jgi:hypothetical protein
MKTLRKTTSDGSQTLYDVDFELGYFEKHHVYVYAGEDNSLYNNQLSYIWMNDTQIELTVPEEYVAGTIINIRRIVPRDKLYVEFKNSTGITQLSLNSANAQALMLIEEQDDGFKPVGYYEKQDLHFDGIHTIRDLPDGVEGGDPLTYRQLFDVENSITAVLVAQIENQVQVATDAAEEAQQSAEELAALLLLEGGGGLLWTTVIPPEAVSAQGYAIDTTNAPIEIDLPTIPLSGYPLGFLDSSGTCETNNIIIRRNGKTIMGLEEDMTISTNNACVVLMYVETTGDWRIIFTTPQGTLPPTVTSDATHISLTFDAIAVAAGLPITIGFGTNELNVQSTQIEIITPFDGGAEVTVGTQVEQDVLLTSAFVDMTLAGAYGKTNDYHYTGIPEFKLFPSGAPTVGEARVTIYFN